MLHYLQCVRRMSIVPYLVTIYYTRLLIYDCASQRTDETLSILISLLIVYDYESASCFLSDDGCIMNYKYISKCATYFYILIIRII